MPYVKKAAAEQVTLVSDPQYWVMWRRKLTYGQMRDIARSGQKMENGETTIDNMAAADMLLLAHIESWNLTDEQDQPLPLTAEGLASLDEDDATQLSKLANSQIEQQEEKRKD